MKLYYSLIVCVFGVIISLIFMATFSIGDETVVSIMGIFAGFLVFIIGIVLLDQDMNKTKRLELIQSFEKDLIDFDSQDLDDLSERKVAFLALYDLYQRLLSMVGVQYCNIPQNQLTKINSATLPGYLS